MKCFQFGQRFGHQFSVKYPGSNLTKKILSLKSGQNMLERLTQANVFSVKQKALRKDQKML
jgi:hypothetical protein